MSLLPLDTDLLIKKHLDFKPLFPITVKMMAVNTKKVQKPKVWTISLKLGKSTNHDQNLYRSDGGQNISACQSADHSFKCLQTLNVARFTKWKLNQKLGKYTDLDRNLLHSEENQDISITNYMLFLPCVIWIKSQKTLRKDRLQTYGHGPKLCLHLLGTKKNSISAHLQVKFSSLTDWIHVILWVT